MRIKQNGKISNGTLTIGQKLLSNAYLYVIFYYLIIQTNTIKD